MSTSGGRSRNRSHSRSRSHSRKRHSKKVDMRALVGKRVPTLRHLAKRLGARVTKSDGGHKTKSQLISSIRQAGQKRHGAAGGSHKKKHRRRHHSKSRSGGSKRRYHRKH